MTTQTDTPFPSSFTADFFVGNRRRLRELVAADAPIVVTANGLLQRNADTGFPFRQDSGFWYLTGIDTPDVVLVMHGDDEFIFLPERDAVHTIFDGTVSHDGLRAVSGVVTILTEAEGWKRLEDLIARSTQVATLAAPDQYIEGAALYTNPARARLTNRLVSNKDRLELVDIRPQLASLRVIKQEPELRALQKAVDITVDGLIALTTKESLQSNHFEYELAADLTRSFGRMNSRHGFEAIVASGERACQLHYIDNNGPLQQNQLLVLDVGAEWSNYTADITRTVAVGEPTKRQQQVFEAVCKVQDYAIDLLKPGADYMEYEKQVERFMGQVLQEIGLIAGDRQPDRAEIRSYFPHATSHFLGLDAHDVGDYKQLLQPGMVITCEPGIYIAEEGIGVRIEDDILITADGNRNMSARLPRQLR